MTDHDLALVRKYAQLQSEAAFETLVSRHINLVYSTALRQTGNPAMAEEITQAVFIILAHKAAQLGSGTVLPGWLYRTTCYAAKDALRAQRRRQHHEHEASMQTALDVPQNDSTWEQLAPLLDDAMTQLRQGERDAIVLRFFEGKSLQEVGTTLGASEDAAKKRVSRALEKLRSIFAKRGVHSTTAIIGEKLSGCSIQAAPALLAKSVSALAFAKGTAASVSTLTLVKGALKIMAWSKAKTAAVVTVATILLTAGTATVVVERHIKAQQFVPAAAPWSDAGAATPKAALQSLAWALAQGKTDRAEQLMQWDEKGTENNSDPTTEHQIILMSILGPAMNDLRSFRIVAIKQTANADDVLVTIEKTFKSKVRPFNITVKLHRTNGQWHAVGDVEYYANGGTSMKLPFTGMF